MSLLWICLMDCDPCWSSDFHHARRNLSGSVHRSVNGTLSLFPECILMQFPRRISLSLTSLSFQYICGPPSQTRTPSGADSLQPAWVHSHHSGFVQLRWNEQLPHFSKTAFSQELWWSQFSFGSSIRWGLLSEHRLLCSPWRNIISSSIYCIIFWIIHIMCESKYTLLLFPVAILNRKEDSVKAVAVLFCFPGYMKPTSCSGIVLYRSIWHIAEVLSPGMSKIFHSPQFHTKRVIGIGQKYSPALSLASVCASQHDLRGNHFRYGRLKGPKSWVSEKAPDLSGRNSLRLKGSTWESC